MISEYQQYEQNSTYGDIRVASFTQFHSVSFFVEDTESDDEMYA